MIAAFVIVASVICASVTLVATWLCHRANEEAASSSEDGSGDESPRVDRGKSRAYKGMVDRGEVPGGILLAYVVLV